MVGKHIVAAVAGLLVLGVIAVLGTGGRLPELPFSALQGYSAGVLVYGALAPVRATGRPAGLVTVLLWTSVVAAAAQQTGYLLTGRRGDLVVVAGWFFLILGFGMVAGAPERLRRMLRRLTHREILEGGEPTATDLAENLLRSGRRYAAWGSVAVMAALMVTWPRVRDVPAGWNTWAFAPAVADQIWVLAAGAVSGGLLGRMVGFGLLGKTLRRKPLPLRLVPGHADHAAGTKPIGDYYFFQSRAAGLPAIFLAIFALVVAFLADNNPAIAHYRPYLYQYVGLLAVAIVFEIFAFIGPLLSIHHLMTRHKDEVLRAEADQISPGIEFLRARLINEDDADRRASLTARLDHLTAHRDRLESAPTWPIDATLRRRFALRNLGFLAPLLTSALRDPITNLVKGLMA